MNDDYGTQAKAHLPLAHRSYSSSLNASPAMYESAAEPTAPYEGVSNERTVLDSCRKSATYAESLPLHHQQA